MRARREGERRNGGGGKGFGAGDEGEKGQKENMKASSDHRLRRSWLDRLKNLVPFGLGRVKPHHFRDMLKVVWRNRDNLGYGWKVLKGGVCDGCALGVAGFHDWTIDGVHLCMTRLNLLRLNTMPALDPARLADVEKLESMSNAELRELGRLAYPMVREKGDKGFRRISWREAYRRAGERIRRSEPERLAFFITSRAITNEVYYVAQKVARYLGTNNIDNAARLCHSPSTGAMKYALGVAASTCSYRDWWGTDCIVFFGSNPANDQPVTTKYLHEAKGAGSKVIIVNPYLEPGMERYWVPSTASSAVFGTAIADYWFPVSQGGDIAFLYGTIKVLLEQGWVDETFVQRHTVDVEALRDQVEQFLWADLEKQAGLPRASMEAFAELIGRAQTGVFVWSMGITQHIFGADAVSMILNLGLLKGFVGRDKCGLMPIRGHSGVQGGAEMGAYSTAFPGGLPINGENAQRLAGQYGFPVPEEPGLTAPQMVDAVHAGEVDVLYCVGGNFLRTLPDPDYVREAMRRAPLRVHQDLILTDQVFIDPGEEVLLLPARTRYEQEGGGTETITERRIVFSPEIPQQVGEAESEWRILLEVAEAARPGARAELGCGSGQAIREEIARVVPFYEGIQHFKKIGDAVQYGGRHLCADGKFPTADGKAHFRVVELPKLDRDPDEFLLSTRRGKQFNTLIYDEVDPLNGAPRDAVLIHPEDASRLGGRNGTRVRLRNKAGSMEGRLFYAPIARGNLQVHWPEGNVLIPRGPVDVLGGVPDYNAVVRLDVAQGEPSARAAV